MSEEARPLWPDRYLTDGRLVIDPGPRPAAVPGTGRARVVEQVARLDWPSRCRRGWHRLLAGVAVVRHREDRVPAEPRPPQLPPEVALAAWDTIEARVAGAATRAWAETLREPAWHSAFLAGTRAAFDGAAEVRNVVDLADRIRQARAGLGARPAGPAAEFWDRQQTALDDAARRLGLRADALIRHRDQAAALSVELQHLTELERMERSAAEVDVLTVETAYGSGRGAGGLGSAGDDIAAVRQAMIDLVDLMTRTRAPLAQAPEVTG